MISAWLSTLSETAAATAAHVTHTNALTSLPLVQKGLITTLGGLLGVFLVLLLFFAAIKLMQNFGRKESSHE